MKALCSGPSSEFSSLCRGAFYIIRAQLTSPEKYLCCQAGGFLTDSAVHGSLNSIVEPPTLLAAEKKEVKSVLTLFLKQQGLSKAVAARTMNRSEPFIDHLVSRLHSACKPRDLLGRELTNLEIRNTLIPYLENLLEEHGNFLVDLVQNFPNADVKGDTAEPVSQPGCSLDSKKQKAVSRVSRRGSEGYICPKHCYLIELGMDLKKLKLIERKFPKFVHYSLERKIKPLVEFLLNLGMPKSHVVKILSQFPNIGGLSLSENIKPMMIFLEDLGVDKKQWARVIYRCPSLLGLSRHKVQAVISFLHELGLSAESIGKIITQFPYIICYSVEDNLRPKAEYFQSLGVDVAIVLRQSPQSLGLGIEAKLKPLTEFFLGRGFSLEEIRTMILRFADLYTFSLTENLSPKWEFFLTMGYSKSDLVKFPQYFGYSLAHRIRPRYALLKESGMKMGLNKLLTLSGCNFEKVYKLKRKKMLSDMGSGGKNS